MAIAQEVEDTKNDYREMEGEKVNRETISEDREDMEESEYDNDDYERGDGYNEKD